MVAPATTVASGSRKGIRYGGRTKGTPNKVTQEFRDTVRKVLEENSENVGKWLTQVAEGNGDATKADPGKALDLLAKLAEFAAPKLARTEVTGVDGGPVIVQATSHDEAL